MKTPASRCFRLAATLVLGGALLACTSCTTTYDYYGRPVQSVDPGVAIAGAAAVGLVGYAIGQANDHHGHGGHYYGGGYGGYYRGCGY